MKSGIEIITYGMRNAPSDWMLNKKPYLNRIHCAIGGKGYYYTGDTVYPIEPGNIYLFPYSPKFGMRHDASDPYYHMYFDFIITPPFFSDKIYKIPTNEDALLMKLSDCLTLMVKLVYDAHINRKFNSPDNEDYAAFEDVAKVFIEYVARRTGIPRVSEKRIIDALRFIQLNYADPMLSNEKLANEFFINPRHFIRLFKNNLNITPHRYLTDYRIAKASEMLASGVPVKNVWYKVGFASENAFRTAFIRSKGTPPSYKHESSDL